MRKNKVLLIYFLCLQGLFSCQDSDGVWSDVQITRGVLLGPEEYKAVVELTVGKKEIGCTGFFLSDTMLMTAAHCMIGNEFLAVPGVAGERIKPHKIYVPRDYTEIRPTLTLICADFVTKSKSSYDFALLTFPKGTAAQLGIQTADFFTISERAPVVGDTYHMVGFGKSEGTKKSGSYFSWGDRKRRLGENTVEEITGGNASLIRANSTAYLLPHGTERLGDNSTEGGDSGGPVFWPGTKEVIGVVSSGTDENTCGYGVLSDFIFSVHSDWAKQQLSSIL